jgi:hypothetical protein
MKSFLFVATLLLAGAILGCHREPPQGPAEKAGRAVDNAARDTKDSVQDTKHDVKKDLDK